MAKAGQLSHKDTLKVLSSPIKAVTDKTWMGPNVFVQNKWMWT